MHLVMLDSSPEQLSSALTKRWDVAWYVLLRATAPVKYVCTQSDAIYTRLE